MNNKGVHKIGLATLLALGLLLIVAVSTVGAEETCCDASISVDILPSCLEYLDGEGVATGVVSVTNTGEQGDVQVTLEGVILNEAFTGTLEPDTFTIWLAPGETKTQPFTVTMTGGPNREQGIEIQWTVTYASCRPEHNEGKRAQEEFEWCDPSSVVCTDFSVQTPKVLDLSPAWIGGAIVLGITPATIFAVRANQKKRKKDN